MHAMKDRSYDTADDVLMTLLDIAEEPSDLQLDTYRSRIPRQVTLSAPCLPCTPAPSPREVSPNMRRTQPYAATWYAGILSWGIRGNEQHHPRWRRVGMFTKR